MSLKLVQLTLHVEHERVFVDGRHEHSGRVIVVVLFRFLGLLLDVLLDASNLCTDLILLQNQLVVLTAEVILKQAVLICRVGSDTLWLLHEVDLSLVASSTALVHLRHFIPNLRLKTHVLEHNDDVGAECLNSLDEGASLFLGLGTETVNEHTTGKHRRINGTNAAERWIGCTTLTLQQLILNLKLLQVVIGFGVTSLRQLVDLRVEQVRCDNEVTRSARAMEVGDRFERQVVCAA